MSGKTTIISSASPSEIEMCIRDSPNTAWEKAKGQYGRVEDAVKIIDPRAE